MIGDEAIAALVRAVYAGTTPDRDYERRASCPSPHEIARLPELWTVLRPGPDIGAWVRWAHTAHHVIEAPRWTATRQGLPAQIYALDSDVSVALGMSVIGAVERATGLSLAIYRTSMCIGTRGAEVLPHWDQSPRFCATATALLRMDGPGWPLRAMGLPDIDRRVGEVVLTTPHQHLHWVPAYAGRVVMRWMALYTPRDGAAAWYGYGRHPDPGMARQRDMALTGRDAYEAAAARGRREVGLA